MNSEFNLALLGRSIESGAEQSLWPVPKMLRVGGVIPSMGINFAFDVSMESMQQDRKEHLVAKCIHK